MSYTITSTNPSNAPITIQDQQLNNSTNLTFVGKNYSSYGPIIAEDFLHLLENFANVASPENQPNGGQALEGQLWYDKGNHQLNVYNGTQWNPVGSIRKANIAPTSALSGDMWVDTANNQVYVYSGSTWLLVGPQFSAGFQTGSQVVPITDISNVTHNVTGIYSDGTLVAIVSNAAFTPKTTILGFSSINQGITLNSVNKSSTTAPTKFWGRASEADALNVNGTTVNSSNFLRSDIVSVTNNPLNIRSDGGISIGGDLSFNLSASTSVVIFNSNTSGRGINFLLKNSTGASESVLYLNANARVGVGPNNTAPATALDVAGVVTVKDDTVSVPTISGQIVVNGTNDIKTNGLLSISNASIVTNGGLAVNKGLYVGGNSIVNGSISFNNLNNNLQPMTGSVMIPGTSSANGYYDIGSDTISFRNVYATTFGKSDRSSNFLGIFTGTFNGNINGSSTSLATSTIFNLAGDITSDNLTFTGAGGTATFNTSVSSTIIADRTEVTDTKSTDYFLISRTTTNPLTNTTNTILRKTSKQTIISNLPVVPVGAIFPFAGTIIPTGYLLCDGSEVQISKYSTLFQVIQYSYRASALLLGYNTFALPDLRGRFPLGADNMNNKLTVPSKESTNILINAGGGAANRVTDVTADTLGAGAGYEKQTLLSSNLPDHTHNMSSGNNQYYAVGAPNVTDSSAIAGYGLSQTNNAGYGYQYSGGVVSNRLAQPVNTMNPYTTINYIIYTGVTS